MAVNGEADTVMANFWPSWQCWLIVQMKQWSPMVVRVMFVGPVVMTVPMGLAVLHKSYDSFGT